MVNISNFKNELREKFSDLYEFIATIVEEIVQQIETQKEEKDGLEKEKTELEKNLFIETNAVQYYKTRYKKYKKRCTSYEQKNDWRNKFLKKKHSNVFKMRKALVEKGNALRFESRRRFYVERKLRIFKERQNEILKSYQLMLIGLDPLVAEMQGEKISKNERKRQKLTTPETIDHTSQSNDTVFYVNQEWNFQTNENLRSPEADAANQLNENSIFSPDSIEMDPLNCDKVPNFCEENNERELVQNMNDKMEQDRDDNNNSKNMDFSDGSKTTEYVDNQTTNENTDSPLLNGGLNDKTNEEVIDNENNFSNDKISKNVEHKSQTTDDETDRQSNMSSKSFSSSRSRSSSSQRASTRKSSEFERNKCKNSRRSRERSYDSDRYQERRSRERRIRSMDNFERRKRSRSRYRNFDETSKYTVVEIENVLKRLDRNKFCVNFKRNECDYEKRCDYVHDQYEITYGLERELFKYLEKRYSRSRSRSSSRYERGRKVKRNFFQIEMRDAYEDASSFRFCKKFQQYGTCSNGLHCVDIHDSKQLTVGLRRQMKMIRRRHR